MIKHAMFRADDFEALAEEAKGWPEYRKTATVRARRMEHPFSVETPEGVMQGAAGDYLVGPGVEGEFWPVGGGKFDGSHEEVVDG